MLTKFQETVLEALVNNPEQPTAEIARIVGAPRSTVHITILQLAGLGHIAHAKRRWMVNNEDFSLLKEAALKKLSDV